MLTRLIGKLRRPVRSEQSRDPAGVPASPAGLENLEPRLLLSAAGHAFPLDLPPTKPVLSVALVSDDDSASEAGDTATFRISRNSDIGDLTVAFTLAGTARVGNANDYTLVGNAVDARFRSAVIPDGQSYVDLVVTPVDDARPESTETVKLVLNGRGTYTLDNAAKQATVNLLDNEPIVSITATDAASTETTDGQTPNTAVFRITRDAEDLTNSLTVSINLSGNASRGTSLARPGDYLLKYDDDSLVDPRAVVIPADQAYVDITVVPTDDANLEHTETLTLSLKNNSRLYTLDRPQSRASATIDDLSIPFVSVKISRIIAAERNPSQQANQARFNLTRSGGDLAEPLTVRFQLSGVADPGEDYHLRTTSGDSIDLDPDEIGQVTFAPGDRTVSVYLVAIDDLETEPNRESAILTLLPDDDAPPAYALTTKASDLAATAFVTDYEVAPDSLEGSFLTLNYRSGGTGSVSLALGHDEEVFFTIARNQVWGGEEAEYNKTSSTAATLVTHGHGESNPTNLALTFNSTTSGSFTGTNADGDPITGSFRITTPRGNHAYDSIAGKTYTAKIYAASDTTLNNASLSSVFGPSTVTTTLQSTTSAPTVYTYEKIAPNFGFLAVGDDADLTWSLVYFTAPNRANLYTFSPNDPENAWQTCLGGSFATTII